MASVELIFLGTGGGRFATITQKRRTGGIRILSETLNVHLDPGPGGLIYSLGMGLDPQKVRTVLISHAHPDHCNDAEILVEAMTSGMTKKRGVLAASHSALLGNEVCEPSISKYHQQMPEKVIETKPGTAFNVNGMKIVATEARHSDPDAVGFRLETRTLGDIAYTSDTEFFEGIGKFYEGVRLLILCIMRPSGEPWKGHMTTDDAIKILAEAKPEKAVITHFGMKMIFGGPNREAELIQQETEVPTIAAVDGMRLSMDNEIQIQKSGRKQRGLEDFLKEE
jgi:phosphoribosyl 1,2-cyclic phosphodiesterase